MVHLRTEMGSGRGISLTVFYVAEFVIVMIVPSPLTRVLSVIRSRVCSYIIFFLPKQQLLILFSGLLRW
jgi:hypothetical protein